jgi:hypothetical protein
MPIHAEKQKRAMTEQTTAVMKQLSEDNAFKVQAVTSSDLSLYDSKKMVAEDVASFKERLKTVMMVDRQSAEVFKEEYADIYVNAKYEEISLNTKASRSGLSKIRHDITGKEKKAAKKKLSDLNTAREALEAEKKKEKSSDDKLIDKIEDDFIELKRRLDDDTAVFLSDLLKEHKELEPLQKEGKLNVYSAYDALTIPLSSAKNLEETYKIIEHNKPITDLFDPLFARHNLVGKLNEKSGAFCQKTVIYEDSQYAKDVSAVSEKYMAPRHSEFNPSNLGSEDIHRDVCRWASPINQAHLIKEKDLVTACTHMKNLYAIDTPEAIVDKEASLKDLQFIGGKLSSFETELKELEKKLPADFLAGKQTYRQLLDNSDTINEYYKKSQSMVNMGAIILTSPVLSLLSEKERASLTATIEYVSSMSYFFKDCIVDARKMDQCRAEGKEPVGSLKSSTTAKLAMAKKMLPIIGSKLRAGQKINKEKAMKKQNTDEN